MGAKIHVWEEVSNEGEVDASFTKKLSHQPDFLKLIEFFLVVGRDRENILSQLPLIPIIVSYSGPPSNNSIFLIAHFCSHVGRFLLPRAIVVVRRGLLLFFLDILGKGEHYLFEGIVVEPFFEKRKGYFYFLARGYFTSVVIWSLSEVAGTPLRLLIR